MLLALSLLMFFCGILVFCIRSSHLVSLVLGMEFMGLGVLMGVSCLSSSSVYLLFMLVMSVAAAEASVMLSFVVVFARFFGSDQVSSASVGLS